MIERFNDIRRVLYIHYSINIASITTMEGGWAALAYKVIDLKGRAYFLKAYDKKRKSTPKWTKLIDRYIPIMLWLNNSTDLNGKVPVSLITNNGTFKCEDNNSIYLLYDFIDGDTVGDAALTFKQSQKLAQIVAKLHMHGGNIPFCTREIEEDFQVPFSQNLIDTVISGKSRVPAFILSRLNPVSTKIIELAHELDILAGYLRNSRINKVLCHTDIHNWNIMHSSENLVLIDWEGLKLAPVEADLMFFKNHIFYEQFMEIYLYTHKNFKINTEAMRFYLIRRQFEDIWEGLEQLLFDNQSEEERKVTSNDLLELLNDLITL